MSIEPNAAETALIEQLKQAGAERAAGELGRTGLPTRRVEAYHYTDLRALLRVIPAIAGAAGEGAAAEPFLQVPGALVLCMVNGEVLPHGPSGEGIVISRAEGSGLSRRDDLLVSLNRELVRESLRLYFKEGAHGTVHVDRQLQGEAGHVLDSVVFDLAPGASVTLIETFSGSEAAHVGNHASRVRLGDGAQLTHVIVDRSSRQATHFHSLEYDMGADVRLHNLAVNSGSSLSRTQMFARFSGERAHGDFSGLNLVDDAQHCDMTLDVIHGVPNTTSTEKFKAVVRNRAKAIFQGRILVESVAQKTDAKMMSQGLMLSEGAQILTKPELEIFADDVQCGHGATCGELDSEALFYLMSRGISRRDAGALLIRAFVQELLDPIADEDINGVLSGIVAEWLEEGSVG